MGMQDFAPVSIGAHELPREQKERAVIARRRELEHARRDRVLNVKNRTIGLDVDSLDAQCKQRSRSDALEKRRDAAMDKAMIASAHQADILQQEVDRVRLAQERELREYRARFQGKTSRLEYDLSDPNKLKTEKTPIEEPDKVGLGSAQLFTGMDETATERKLVQAEQMRAWCAEQIQAKEETDRTQRNALLRYEHAQNQIAASLDSVISLHTTSKKNIVLATAAENKALADAKRSAADADKASTQALNQSEINSALASPFLSEDLSTTVSAINPNRPVPYHFKGLPEEYRQHILDAQMHQARDQHEAKVAGKANDAAWEQYMLSANRQACVMERSINRARGQQRQELAATLKQQAAEKDGREGVAVSADPTAGFFEQFGTSSR